MDGGMLPKGRLMIVDASNPAHYDTAAGRSDQKCLIDTPLLTIQRSKPIIAYLPMKSNRTIPPNSTSSSLPEAYLIVAIARSLSPLAVIR